MVTGLADCDAEIVAFPELHNVPLVLAALGKVCQGEFASRLCSGLKDH